MQKFFNSKLNIFNNCNMEDFRGAWIAEWSSHSTSEHWYAMPWAMRLILGDDYSFSAQA